MLVNLTGPLGIGALSLEWPLCGALPVGIRCCGSLCGGWGGTGWGVITHACERKASEGNEVWRMSPSQRVVPPSAWTTIPLPLCLQPLTRVGLVPWSASLPMPGQSDGLQWGPGSVAHPGRFSQAGSQAASRHFITLHQIKSNKLITNDCGHASSKYRINIIDLILSMLSEKLVNAWAKITAPFPRATATIR